MKLTADAKFGSCCQMIFAKCFLIRFRLVNSCNMDVYFGEFRAHGILHFCKHRIGTLLQNLACQTELAKWTKFPQFLCYLFICAFLTQFSLHNYLRQSALGISCSIFQRMISTHIAVHLLFKTNKSSVNFLTC